MICSVAKKLRFNLFNRISVHDLQLTFDLVFLHTIYQSKYKQSFLLKYHFSKIIVGFFLILSATANSQMLSDSNSVHIISHEFPKETASQKDIVDVARKLFQKKPSLKSDIIRPGDKPVLTILPAVGYTLQTRFAVILAGNDAFYTSNKPGAQLSVINASPTYTQNSQFTLPIQLNIWLKGDKYNLLGDWRFMQYPQSTYGLGSNTSLSQQDAMDYDYIRIYQYILRKFAPNFSAGIGYTLDQHWNIEEDGPVNNPPSEYEVYGTAKRTTSSGPALMLLYDSRNNPINSSKGLSASLVFRHNVTWMGSSSNWQSVLLDIRKYFQFPGRSKNVLAFWSYNWVIVKGKPPYLDLPAVGWDNFNNTGRGYIQGRFRGNLMLYLESEYRFGITNNGLIGGVAFANAETFSNGINHQPQSVEPGFGLGLRIKLNKKSNTNVCIDYGFGTEGMRGFFVNVGEVF